MFLKIALKNFAKLTGKHLNQSLFFYKVAGLQQQLYLKRNSGNGVCLLIFQKLLKHLFYRTRLRDYFSTEEG